MIKLDFHLEREFLLRKMKRLLLSGKENGIMEVGPLQKSVNGSVKLVIRRVAISVSLSKEENVLIAIKIDSWMI